MTRKSLKMTEPRVLVFSGYGLNCEEETAFAFNLSGSKADIVHINDLIADKKKLKQYQILAIPGGFSYGDDTGSGRAYANKIKTRLLTELNNFIKKDKLIIGICNGFQILSHLNLLPGALVHNTFARYLVRWVDLKVSNDSPWLKGIKTLSCPIAHGEGKFYASGPVLKKLRQKNMIAMQYVKGELCQYQNLESNPNGSLENIAGITDETGKILGLMPHPERAIFFHHLPHWTWLKEQYLRSGKKLPQYGSGLKIFKNGMRYFL